MKTENRNISTNGLIVALGFLTNAIVLSRAITHSSSWYWGLFLTIPLLVIALWEARH